MHVHVCMCVCVCTWVYVFVNMLFHRLSVTSKWINQGLLNSAPETYGRKRLLGVLGKQRMPGCRQYCQVRPCCRTCDYLPSDLSEGGPSAHSVLEASIPGSSIAFFFIFTPQPFCLTVPNGFNSHMSPVWKDKCLQRKSCRYLASSE